MGDLLNATDLTATYYKGSGILRLGGSYTAPGAVTKPSFVEVTQPGGSIYELRGTLATSTSKLPDQDIKTVLPSKSTNLNIFVQTASSQPTKVAIKYVDGQAPASTTSSNTTANTTTPANPSNPASSSTAANPSNPANTSTSTSATPTLGGNRGLPPTELAFDNWLSEAFKRVKAKYPNPVPILMSADATKVPNPNNPSGKEVLSMTGYFRVQPKQMVVIQDNTFTISDLFPANSPPNDIKDMSKLQNLNDVVSAAAVKTPNITSYKYVELNWYPNGKNPSQPYYYFMVDGLPPNTLEARFIACVGAYDGKLYEVSS